MKKTNLKVVEKKVKDATAGLTGEQLDEINLELEMSEAVLDVLSYIDSAAELGERTVSIIAFYLKEKIIHVFEILNGEKEGEANL